MRLREQWKQPVSLGAAWKSILLTVVLLAGILAFGPIIEHSRFGRLSKAILLLLVWASAAAQVTKIGWRKIGWRAWLSSQGLWLIAYTAFVGGQLLPQKAAAASWLTNLGGALLMALFAVAFFDFRKPRPTAAGARSSEQEAPD